MIEFPDVPAVRVVTIGAPLSETAFVHIIALVAVTAFFARAFVAGVRVALRARDNDVQSDERKSAQVMIKCNVGAPAVRLMALFAVSPKFSGVNVLSAMTVVAGGV